MKYVYLVENTIGGTRAFTTAVRAGRFFIEHVDQNGDLIALIVALNRGLKYQTDAHSTAFRLTINEKE